MSRKKRRARRGSKAKSQKRHARRRAEERFSVQLSEQVVAQLIRQIRKGESEPVFRQSNRVVHHRVSLGEEKVIAVYDKLRGTIVTFLYDDDDSRWHGRPWQAPPVT